MYKVQKFRNIGPYKKVLSNTGSNILIKIVPVWDTFKEVKWIKCHICIFNTVIQFAVKQYHLPACLSENKNNDVYYRWSITCVLNVAMEMGISIRVQTRPLNMSVVSQSQNNLCSMLTWKVEVGESISWFSWRFGYFLERFIEINR